MPRSFSSGSFSKIIRKSTGTRNLKEAILLSRNWFTQLNETNFKNTKLISLDEIDDSCKTYTQRGVVPSGNLKLLKDGMKIKVAGMIQSRQRPGTAGGVLFMTMEDETDCANLVVFKNLFEKFRKEILHCQLIMADGILQIEGSVIHVVVKRFEDLSFLLKDLTKINSDLPLLSLARADERNGHIGNVFPKGRNFR